MPAGYAATTNMDSTLSGGFEFTAELSDLRIIELPEGMSRAPSNILSNGGPFAFYTDIHFVDTSGAAWPPIAVDVRYFVEGYGTASEAETALVPDVYVGPPIVGTNASHPLRVDIPVHGLLPGIYKVAAAVQVRWADGPATPIMSGFIEGAPVQVLAPQARQLSGSNTGSP